MDTQRHEDPPVSQVLAKLCAVTSEHADKVCDRAQLSPHQGIYILGLLI